MLDHLGDVTAEPRGVDYIETDAGGVAAMWATPKSCAQDRVLLCAHGGGFIAGSIYSHRKMFAHVAKAVGCRALLVDYRLSPESPHPSPVDDMLTAYRSLLEQGIAPGAIALVGDSAGGGLIVTTMLKARDQGTPLPAAAVPLSPWFDMRASGESYDTNADKDCLISRPVILGMAGAFLGAAGDPDDPLASPLHAELAGLPPMLIQVGSVEALLDDSRNFAARAKAAGVDVTLEIIPDMQHVFHILAGAAPEADAAIANIAAWLRARLGLA